jgi:hypothetical protein
MHLDGCPGWQKAEANPLATLAALGTADVTICRRLVTTVGETERAGSIGSPTVLLEETTTCPNPAAIWAFLPALHHRAQRRTPPVLSS